MTGGQKGKVMVVEDSPLEGEILVDALRPICDPYQISEGRAAIAAAHCAPPDLILLDVVMPGMDGFEVCRLLKRDPVTAEIPVIFLTSMGEVGRKAKGFELGAVDYITKPFEEAEVTARVRTHLALRNTQEELRRQNEDLEGEVRRRIVQVQETLARLKASSLVTIERLSFAAESRDEDTGHHIKRISRYAAVVAYRMGLPELVVDSILYAAPMHDVGKIGVPDRILLKPGRLEQEEMEVMKTHTLLGAKMLEGGRGFMGVGRTIALTHHEKWDGTGYPRGLKGKEIPLAGRITAIVDVFDAISCKRPYKVAWPLEDCLGILREESGRHFDPEVVHAFFSGLEQILAIRKDSLA